MEDRRNYGTADDTFFSETIAAMIGEEMATVTAGGDDIVLQPGPWGEEHLHRTLPILMGAVGLSRLDLAAVSSLLQPPPVGQDWEQMLLLSADPTKIFTTYSSDYNIIFRGHHGLLTLLPAKGYGLDMCELPVSLIKVVLVSMGEGEIIETDVRRPGLPLYITHCAADTRPLQSHS